MAKTNYKRGEMEINDHKGTFSGFMGVSKYGAVAIIVMLMFPILTFAANVAWAASLLVTVILGVVLGVALKFKAQWYAGLIGSAVFLFIMITLLLLLF
jgi:hypothetical protein